jgi:hypothetical protein
MEDDLTQLKEALDGVPPEEREGWISQFIELVKQKGSGKLTSKIYLPTLSQENFENAYRIIAGVMGWELEQATNQIGAVNQRQALELIDSARKSFPFYQKIELEKLRKTPSNYPLSGAELVQWMLFHRLEAAEKRDESELLKANASPHQQTLVLRYLKSLIFHVGYKRPFRLIGGITCLLYTFDVFEFEKVYDCLTQGKENEYTKDRYETNLRQHIRDHLTHVFKRFRHFLAVGDDNTPWREFKEIRSDVQSVAPSVEQSLKLLLPWDSINRLPENFGKENTAIPFFANRKTDWRGRSIVGRDRRRLLVDQELLDRIAGALKCPPIFGNYFIPRFKKMNKPKTFPSGLDQLPKPDHELVEEFERRGEQHVKRLKQLNARTLFVRVDDERRGQVYDVREKEPLHLSITAEDKVIEIFTRCGNEEVSLGAVVPDAFGVFDYPEAQRAKVSWHLPNGRKIITRLSPAPDALVNESGLASKIDLFITCKNVPFRDLLFWPLGKSRINFTSIFPVRLTPVLKWVAASVILFLAILFIVQLRKEANRDKADRQTPRLENSPLNSNSGSTPTPEVAGANQNRPNTVPSPEVPVGPSNPPPQKGVTAQKPQRLNPPSDDELIKKDSIPLEEADAALAVLNVPTNLQLDRGVIVPTPLGSEDTRGAANTGGNFSAFPNGTYVKTDRPVLRWSPLDKAQTYVVSVWDSKDRLVDKGQPSRPTWQTSKSLAHDEFYRWEVEAKDTSGQTLPHVIKGAFSTLTAKHKEEVERDEKRYAQSHLLLGITYFKAGLLDDADREFKLLVAANPSSTNARSLLRRVQEARTKRR